MFNLFNKKPLKNKFVVRIPQVGLVTDDLDRTLDILTGRFGIGPFKIWETRPPEVATPMLRGEPSKWQVRLAVAMIGDTQWKVVQPVAGSNIFSEALAERGQSAHHVLLETGNVEFDAALKRLADHGMPCVQRASFKSEADTGSRFGRLLNQTVSSEYAYADAQDELGAWLELCHMPGGISGPMGLRLARADHTVPEGSQDITASLPNAFLDRITKVGIVTRDAKRLLKNWADDLGIGPWRIFRVDSEFMDGIEATFRGERASFQNLVAWALVGDMLIEINQPLQGKSYIAEALERQGEGIHTLGLNCDSLPFSAARDHITSMGYEEIAAGSARGEYSFAYFDTYKDIGVNLQINSLKSGDLSSFADDFGPDNFYP